MYTTEKKDLKNMTTLCYIESEDSFLMMHRVKKKNDVNEEKWVGIGGHFKEGESPQECLVREVKEETGLTLTSYRYAGIITFVSDQWGSEYMHLFTADAYEGTIYDEEGNFRECPEGLLSWVKKDAVNDLSIWEGDKIFFKLLSEKGPFFSLKLCYEGEKLVEAALDGKQLALHTFDPIWNEQSEVLILGSFPSVKSREQNFYYGHKQNRFWKMLAEVTHSKLPKTIEEKRQLLLTNHIALWDVVHCCQITGSSDQSLRELTINDVGSLLAKSNIKTILGNGAKATMLYNTYLKNKTKKEIIQMPSTSPANAMCPLEKLIEAYGNVIREKTEILQ